MVQITIRTVSQFINTIFGIYFIVLAVLGDEQYESSFLYYGFFFVMGLTAGFYLYYFVLKKMDKEEIREK